MAEPILVSPGVRVPGRAFEVRSVRASGPGGQNVNKVASKVILLLDPAEIEGLNGDALKRLVALAGSRLSADGRIRFTAQASRDRSRNLDDARRRAAVLVRNALEAPVVRRPTRATRASRERRLGAKKRGAVLKKTRAGVRSTILNFDG